MAANSNPAPEESDVLRGMKAICGFLKMSESTVLKWAREYDNFPMKKNGNYVSSRKKLNEWFRWYLEQWEGKSQKVSTSKTT